MAWAPDYITADDLKDYARIGDDVDDVQVALAIASASRAVDAACRRQFGKVAAAELRTFYARPDYTSGYWVADVDDFHTLTGLVVNVAGSVATTYTAGPVNAGQVGRPWTRINFVEATVNPPTYTTDIINVTANWGWSSVPQAIAQATLLQASRILMRRNAPFGVAGSPEMGNELRLLSKLDPDVSVLLKGYKRPRRTG